jgi:16S rRNA (adenine1518-N6/adenine1519-N6)-dimethyltransferase
VVGNLPYNVSSPILFKILRDHRAGGGIRDATLMLQHEVAERLEASPGTGEYGVLAILVQLHADVQRVLTLPPGAFRPVPRVRSAVVRLTFRAPAVSIRDERRFEQLVRSIFTQRRKTMANALRPFAEAQGRDPRGILANAAIDPMRRPETLTLPELARLSDLLSSP